jgi:hypothetical protein
MKTELNIERVLFLGDKMVVQTSIGRKYPKIQTAEEIVEEIKHRDEVARYHEEEAMVNLI